MAYSNVLVDTGFWIGLFNPNDQHHSDANTIFDLVKENNFLLVPWPTLYEFLNTRFTRKGIEGFKTFVGGGSAGSLKLIDDSSYKDAALKRFLDDRGKRFSLVDLVIQEMLSDTNIRIDYLVTFNTGDFEDICQRRQIEILSNL